MAEPSPSPSSPRLTPKRKRDNLINEQHIPASPLRNLAQLAQPSFSFQPQIAPDQAHGTSEDGCNSPRSRVVQKFQDLAIGDEGESGGGVTTPATNINKNNHGLPQLEPANSSPDPHVFDFNGVNNSSENTRCKEMDSLSDGMQVDDEDDAATRKRIKCDESALYLEMKPDTDASLKGEDRANIAGPIQVNESGHLALQTAVDPTLVRISKSGGNGRLQKSYPSINRLQDSKSRSRRRAGTPPVSSKRKTAEPKVENEPEVIDPIRAALTWQENEITVYDPEDKDDDRRGMDGIGFKPSPAIAYQRDQMRRRQLAEYRRREENEARARRNQRRRVQLGTEPEAERKHAIARVRFSDSEPATVVTT